MINRFQSKLPLVKEWINETLQVNQAIIYPVKHLTIMQNFNRLPLYFSDVFLSKAKFAVVERVPMPPLSAFGLPEFGDFEKTDFAGITYKDTYFIKRQNCTDESIHFHELVHVIQWDYLGVDRFLLAYAIGLQMNGYASSPFEAMAYNLQRHFQQDLNPFPVSDVVRTEIDTNIIPVLNQVMRSK